MTGLRAIVAAVILAVLAGCSTTTFLYNRLDRILPWILDDYVELDREQDRQLDELLAVLLRWHRMEELPGYIELIEQLQQLLDRPVTAAELEEIWGQFEAAWVRIEIRGVDMLLELAASASDRQIAEFLDNLQREQDEFREKYLERSLEEYREDSYDYLVDFVGGLMGRLGTEQKQIARRATAELYRSDGVWLDERAAWQQRLVEILAREPGWQQRLREALANREADLLPGHRELYAHNRQVLLVALADILNCRSDYQDRRLRRKLAAYREDFETLVEQGRERSAAEAGTHE